MSPASQVAINKGEIRQIKPRVRAYTDVATTPPVINATVLNGIGQFQRRSLYIMRVQLGDLAKRIAGTDTRFFDAVKEGQSVARLWKVKKSKLNELSGKTVLMEIPKSQPTYPTGGKDNSSVELHMLVVD